MTWIEYFENAAQKSQQDSFLWVRYLNKGIQREQLYLSESEIDFLVHSHRLTLFQRVFLKLAVQEGTTPWEITVSLSEKMQRFPHLTYIIEKVKNDETIIKTRE